MSGWFEAWQEALDQDAMWCVQCHQSYPVGGPFPPTTRCMLCGGKKFTGTQPRTDRAEFARRRFQLHRVGA